LKYTLDRREFLSAMSGFAAGCALPAFAARQSVSAESASPGPAPAIGYGTDYYAEDWPSERVEIDAGLMRPAKFRTVRLLDTNWKRVEPEEGRFNFGWLDRVIEILDRHGMRVVLGTSSYVPPAWLSARHPEFVLVEESGQRRRWGAWDSCA
jgi:beta-galactosidase